VTILRHGYITVTARAAERDGSAEIGHSSPSAVEAKSEWSCSATTPVSLRGIEAGVMPAHATVSHTSV